MVLFFWLFVFLVDGFICGIVTNKILDNRGIYKNWFWLGFFFGIFAVIAAAAVEPPHCPQEGDYYNDLERKEREKYH